MHFATEKYHTIENRTLQCKFSQASQARAIDKHERRATTKHKSPFIASNPATKCKLLHWCVNFIISEQPDLQATLLQEMSATAEQRSCAQPQPHYNKKKATPPIIPWQEHFWAGHYIRPVFLNSTMHDNSTQHAKKFT